MGLESASSINDLVTTNPNGATDPKGEGDDHIRMLKNVLKNAFPGLSGAINRKVAKNANYTVVETDNTVFFDCTGTLVFSTAPAATLGGDHMWGFYVRSGTLQIDPNAAEQINGASSILLNAGSWGFVYCSGTDFTVVGNFSLPSSAIPEAWPVNSIYISVSATNPASTIGYGTWTAFATGRTLVALDGANPLMDTVEETFGVPDTIVPAHTHTLTDPGHSHGYTQSNFGSSGGPGGSGSSTYGAFAATTSSNGSNITVNSAGVAVTNKNYQPSIAVYMWKRTA